MMLWHSLVSAQEAVFQLPGAQDLSPCRNLPIQIRQTQSRLRSWISVVFVVVGGLQPLLREHLLPSQ